MRIISKPNISPIRTFIRCYLSFRIATKDNFRNIAEYINSQSFDYDRRANTSRLYTFSTHNHVDGNIYKNDMIKLYKDKMVGHKTGRKIYDKLMALPELSICPFCGIGEIEGLDHYLPESKFPTFSVLPYNLVAACNKCNKGKLTSYAVTQNLQTLHPYYDNFTTQQWLFARVLNTSPVSIEFYVNAPSFWTQVDKDRVKAHFDNYCLAQRFSLKAASDLAKLRYKLSQYFTNVTDIANELKNEYTSYQSLHLNSWETAMYQALYQDQWYCNGGYSQ